MPGRRGGSSGRARPRADGAAAGLGRGDLGSNRGGGEGVADVVVERRAGEHHTDDRSIRSDERATGVPGPDPRFDLVDGPRRESATVDVPADGVEAGQDGGRLSVEEAAAGVAENDLGRTAGNPIAEEVEGGLPEGAGSQHGDVEPGIEQD